MTVFYIKVVEGVSLNFFRDYAYIRPILLQLAGTRWVVLSDGVPDALRVSVREGLPPVVHLWLSWLARAACPRCVPPVPVPVPVRVRAIVPACACPF